MTQLGVEAIVNSTNESMTDKNPVTERIFNKAGIQLKNDIRNNIKSKCLNLTIVLLSGLLSSIKQIALLSHFTFCVQFVYS